MSGPDWSLTVNVATTNGKSSVSDNRELDMIAHPLADESFLPTPSSVAARGASYCTDTIAGRPMRVRLYQTDKYGGGPFIVDAAWPVAKGSWLTFAIATHSEATRDVMLTVLRSLRVDTSTAMLTRVHPRASCPSWPEIHPTAMSQRRYVGPVTFEAPAQLTQSHGSFTAAWDLPDSSSLRFTILRTPGWQLPQVAGESSLLPEGTWLWCQLNLHGHLTEFLVDTTIRIPSYHFAQMYNIQAFMRLTPNSVLAIQGATYLSKNGVTAQGAIRELFQILESARVSSHP